MVGLLFVIFIFVLLEKLYDLIKTYLEPNIVSTEKKEYVTVIDKREFHISEENKMYVIYLSCFEEYGKALTVSKDEYSTTEIGSKKRVKVQTLLYKDEIFLKYKLLKDKHK